MIMFKSYFTYVLLLYDTGLLVSNMGVLVFKLCTGYDIQLMIIIVNFILNYGAV